MKNINSLINKLENRINEQSIDIQDNKVLIKGIEDDIFIMLQKNKEFFNESQIIEIFRMMLYY